MNEIVSEEITKVVGDAPEEYDTLGELAQYAAEHKIESDKRDEIISANTKEIIAIKEQIAAGGESESSWEHFE